MKFGKSLSNQIDETLPEWRDKFLSYKELKKRLKLINPVVVADESTRPEKRRRISTGECMSDHEEIDFLNLLEDELEKFNCFFVEKEEEYIIRLKDLRDRVASAEDWSEAMIDIRKEIVDFHGEMVLLENYSALNYTGLVKILKKYDKRTGALLRLPFIQKVLQQPFFTTDLLYKLVKECEAMLDRLFPMAELPPSSGVPAKEDQSTPGPANNDDVVRSDKEVADIEYVKSLYMKSTISALRVLKEIRSGSSTVSAFSLPPLQISGRENAWIQTPILQEEAK
ncbi:SPX domain-containing protein [Heracleum sosnowskyi]|uniref:SPX domain-containing protein n=1 Tax=Heracleum sosnowskyi TaxID=360622 RepID=A0AAD8JCB9_9APIA|nr:SPX domain-containing protein [Heracleum sosnowskyi]